jgi:cytidylate kinase
VLRPFRLRQLILRPREVEVELGIQRFLGAPSHGTSDATELLGWAPRVEPRHPLFRLTPASKASSVERVPCKVVCISHATGAGGEEVGRLVAERLGFLYVDEEIVARAAAKGGLDASDVADEEQRKSFVARALQAFAQTGGEAWALGAAVPPRFPDDWTGENVRSLIREVIEQTANRGSAVIVAHAASHAVARGRDALRVLVTGSPEVRARRLAQLGKLDDTRAARAVKESDAGRRDYLKRFYGLDEELPTQYDLVINTDVLPLARAAELVARAGRR